MFSVPLILYFLFIAGAVAFAAIVVYHTNKYTAPADPARAVTTIFIALLLISISISAFLFSRVPWETVLQ